MALLTAFIAATAVELATGHKLLDHPSIHAHGLWRNLPLVVFLYTWAALWDIAVLKRGFGK